MMRKLLLPTVALGLLLPAMAEEPAPKAAVFEMSELASLLGGAPGGGAESANKLPAFEEVTKGMKSSSGLFTLWSYPADAKDQDQEKLLAQIPAAILGEQLMLSTSFSGGGFFTGFPLSERVVKWELHGNQLVLVEPETRFVVDNSKEVSDVVKRTYPDSIRIAVPLVTKTASGDPVIDLGPMLKSNFADIGWTTGGGFEAMFGGGGANINGQLSKWTKRKSFELNVELGVELAIARMSPPGSFDKKMVHYSFWKLPQTDYQPRLADERVGYFHTTNADWSKPVDARELQNRYVNRWHLVKRDPSLKQCEPKQPIIFYIEKTVPVKYRRAVRDGILAWNEAYEQIGFVNAVEVRQQTDDNEWKDLDPEDMRYSFFRWIVTGAGFAMGPSRANPFTGQIYDADIIFDDSMVRFYSNEAQTSLPSALAAKFEDPALRSFLEHNPDWQRPTQPWTSLTVGDSTELEVRKAALRRMQQSGRLTCSYAEGMKHQMRVAQTALAGQPPEVIERFLYEVIREVVMHEVGHTLGLRHNFKASSIYTLDEIQRRRTTGQALVGSVMDYNPALLFAKNATDGSFITPRVGPYDAWAIEYGYRPADGAAPTAAPTKPDAKPADKPAPTLAASTNGQPKLDELPKEVIDKLPAEVREAIAAGGAKIMTTGGPTPTGSGDADAPAFAAAPAGEQAMLQQIAGRAHEPELAYATDEDTTFVAPDPRVNRFDMGADPIDWARTRIELVDKRLSNILEWGVREQEPWYHLRNAYLTLMAEKAMILDYVGRYVGGQYFHRARRGDANAPTPFVLVDAARQRAALAFIEENLYTDKFFNFDPNVLNHLAPSRWWEDDSNIDMAMDFPVHEFVSALQWSSLFDRLFPNNLRRLQDNELKSTDADKLTVAEYVQRLTRTVWSDATDAQRVAAGGHTDAAPFVSRFRRSLQREFLGLIEPTLRSRPGAVVSPDIHAMLRFAMQKLSADLNAVINTQKADFASHAHLVACRERIERMLNPQLNELGMGGFGGMSMMMRENHAPRSAAQDCPRE